MSWEFVLCRHVPRLNNHHLIGNTDSEIIIQAGNTFSLNTNTIVLFVFVLAVALVLSWTYFTLARAFTKQFIWITGILNILFGIGTAIYYFIRHYYSAAVVFAVFGIFSIVRPFRKTISLIPGDFPSCKICYGPRRLLTPLCCWDFCLEEGVLTPRSS